MDFYQYVFSELWVNGYDAETLTPMLISLIQQEDTNTKSISTLIDNVHEIFNSFAPQYNLENLSFAQELIRIYYQPNELLNKSYEPTYYYMNIHSLNKEESYASNISLKSLDENEKDTLDNVNIDSLQCIDLSVNANVYDPLASSFSKQMNDTLSVLPNETFSYSLTTSSSKDRHPSESETIQSGYTDIECIEVSEDDSSCFESDLSFALGYLESIMYQSYSMGTMKAPETPYTTECLEMSLLLSNLDAFNAIEVITFNANIIATTRPCAYQRSSGKCFRRDCYFDHNFHELPCKFWFSSLEGCSLPDCPFLHGLKVPEAYCQGISCLNNQNVNNSNVTINLSEELFPSLSSGKSTKDKSPSKSTTNEVKQPIDPKSLLNFTVGKTSHLLSANSNIQVNKVKSSTSSSSMTSSSSGLIFTKDDIIDMKLQALSNSSTSLNSSKFLQNAWVDSGSSVAYIYKEKREEARMLAISRNKLLEEATKAFISGAKDTANRLSRQGQELNRQMKDCHLQAARDIFRIRNTKTSLTQGQIDLHGLHISEASICLQELLPCLRDQSTTTTTTTNTTNTRMISIVTGTGHHTLGSHQGEARLLPAVMKLMEDMNLRYQEIRDHNGHVGGLRVML